MNQQSSNYVDISGWETNDETVQIHVRVPAATKVEENGESPLVSHKTESRTSARRTSVPIIQNNASESHLNTRREKYQ